MQALIGSIFAGSCEIIYMILELSLLLTGVDGYDQRFWRRRTAKTHGKVYRLWRGFGVIHVGFEEKQTNFAMYKMWAVPFL